MWWQARPALTGKDQSEKDQSVNDANGKRPEAMSVPLRPQVHLVHTFHGFNVSDRGADALDQLDPYLAMLDQTWVLDWDRDREGLMAARFKDDDIVRDVWEFVSKPTHGTPTVHSAIGHSHGCNLIAQLSHGMSLRHAILINPALRVSTEVKADYVTCFYAPSDNVVRSSLLLRLLPWNWIWKHPWGPAGAVGLKGAHNIDLDELAGQHVGHSGAFRPPCLPLMAETILRILGTS